MSKKVIRLITLVLAIAMVACLAVGCGGDSDVNSNNPSSKPSQSVNDKAPGMLAGVDPADYKGTTVKYASWKDPALNEDRFAVESFEKKYDINFEWVQVPQGSYVNKIVSDIAAGQQADIFFENGSFPGSLNAMEPLDRAKIDLTDPIWNQALIKASTLDGHAYLVDAISNVWAEVDICVYNKEIFDNTGIKSPAEYYEEGDWTFANFRKAAMEVSAQGYEGAAILGEPALGAAGASIFTYKDNKMIVTADNHLYDVMNFLADMKVDGYGKFSRQDFENGKFGMALTNCFALKKTGYFPKINPNHIAATYLPVWEKGGEQYVTGIYRGWGLIDGAENPVAAGIFLRHYLDVGNYELDKAFHNDDVRDFFFQVTGTYSENMLYYHGTDMQTSTGLGDNYHEYWTTYATDVTKALDGQKNVMEQMCKKANEIIDKERAWLKDAESKGYFDK